MNSSQLCHMKLCFACRFNEKGSKFTLDGSVVQHWGDCDSKGAPAMLERLHELPEGKKKTSWPIMCENFCLQMLPSVCNHSVPERLA